MSRTPFGVAVLILAGGAPRTAAQPLTVASGISAAAPVSRRDTLELSLSRPLAAADGRLGIVLGATDLSALFRVDGTQVVYGPNRPPLPPGESDLVVSTVSPDGVWAEVGRFRLKVRTRAGFDASTLAPVADLANKSQVSEGHQPESAAPPRETFRDFTGQLGFRSEHVRGDFSIRSSFNVTAVSFVNEALRFGTLGADAPKADLASWAVEVQKGWAKLVAGQVSFGDERHLARFFNSRGLALTLAPSRVVTVTLAAASGAPIAGWTNFLGIGDTEHKVRVGILGLELFPSRPGGFRLELTALDGALQPLAGFNQGAVQSAEKSQGGALRILFTDSAQRLRLDAGFARSRFQAASDPQLEQGLAVTPLPDRTRNAEYADLSVVPFPRVVLSPTVVGPVSIALRHERVEPQYRSVATFAQADRMTNGADLTASFGVVNLLGSVLFSEDNLDDLPNVLKTKTNRAAGNVSLAFPMLLGSGGRPATWAPSMTLQADRTHQYGANRPVNADLVLSFVPDLVATTAGALLTWQLGRVQAGYRFSWSFQDNQQAGREKADLRNTVNGVTAGLSVSGGLGLQAQLSLERSDNLETGRTDETRRLGGIASWQPFPKTSLLVSGSLSLGRDKAGTSENDNEEISVEVGQAFSLGRLLPQSPQGTRGRAFVRYASRFSSFFDTTFGFRSERSGWQWNAGLTLSLF